MRTIIKETGEQQVHSDENGREYVYRKDFIAGGDMQKEFSLSLCYSRMGGVLIDRVEEAITPIVERMIHDRQPERTLGPGTANEL